MNDNKWKRYTNVTTLLVENNVVNILPVIISSNLLQMTFTPLIIKSYNVMQPGDFLFVFLGFFLVPDRNRSFRSRLHRVTATAVYTVPLPVSL